MRAIILRAGRWSRSHSTVRREGGRETPWRLEGTYFENCNCDMVCPCTTSGLTAPADNDRCDVFLVFHVDSGDVDGVNVSGLSVGMVADTPALMNSGN
jgi:hypothetical protein